MYVANDSIVPPRAIAHLLCVPGSTASVGGASPRDCADDLRLLAAHDVGNAFVVATRRDRERSSSARSGVRTMPRASDAERRGTFDVGRLDPPLPAADHAAREPRNGIVMSPVAEERAERPREVAAHLLDPERRLARSSTAPPASSR